MRLAITLVLGCLAPGARGFADVLVGDAPLLVPPGAADAGSDGPGLAIRARKVLTVARSGDMVVDRAVVLVRGGKIEAVGPARELPIPTGYVVIDARDLWVMPGLVELHNHIAAPNALFINDINDTVYLTNPGLRASAGVRPGNYLLRAGVAGGVTTALFIPGSGSNMGGQGVLLKIGLDIYEEMELRNPGSLKLAQAGNPEGWTIGVGRTFMNWNTRNTFRRGMVYAKSWERFEQGEAEKPEKDLQLEVFRDLYSKRAQVSTHTQWFQVVLMTITMVRLEFGLDVFIDHGSFHGHLAAAIAQAAGVPAILGPRMITMSRTTYGWDRFDTDGQIQGIAANYQKAGHTMIGFNTDCVDDGRIRLTPPQEQLSLQAGMAVRYGLENLNLDSIRGLTIVPAMAVGLGDRIGSIEPGKDADLVLLSGDAGDPRTAIELVLTNGKIVYDAEQDGRRW